MSGEFFGIERDDGAFMEERMKVGKEEQGAPTGAFVYSTFISDACSTPKNSNNYDS